MSESWMCKGSNHKKDCPLKGQCYRYTREPNKDQLYYRNIPYEENGNRCDFNLPKWVIDELKTNKK